MKIKLFADSASDLPLSFFEENNVGLFPLQVHIDNNDYKDLQTIKPEQIYEKLDPAKCLKHRKCHRNISKSNLPI